MQVQDRLAWGRAGWQVETSVFILKFYFILQRSDQPTGSKSIYSSPARLYAGYEISIHLGLSPAPLLPCCSVLRTTFLPACEMLATTIR